MARTLTASGLVLLLALGLAPASAADPHRKPGADLPPASSIRLPARITSACTRATGDMVYVCDEYARLYRETELARLEAIRKLEMITYGGVAEQLE